MTGNNVVLREVSKRLKKELAVGRLSLMMEGKGLILGLAIGVIVGLTGGTFVAALKFAIQVRDTFEWVMFCLPLAGLVIVWLYQRAGSKASGGTNLVIVGARGDGKVPQRLAPLIFISTILTHMFGGSAGREGAALQMGGSLASWLGKRIRLSSELTDIAVLCGMSAGFSAVFGNKISAVVFALEISYVGVICLSALFPCVVASITAGTVSGLMGMQAAQFHFAPMESTPLLYAKVMVLAVLCAWLSILVCHVFQGMEHWMQKLLHNEYVRIVAGGCLVVLLVWICQTKMYLGSGQELIYQAIVKGDVPAEAFLLKLIFTAITLSVGFRGGEIVPVFAIGATFGCVVGPLLHVTPSFGAAVGMIALFCSVTNCPIASLCLAFEVFGFHNPEGFLVAVSVSFLTSGYSGLYSKQKFAFSKIIPEQNKENESENDSKPTKAEETAEPAADQPEVEIAEVVGR